MTNFKQLNENIYHGRATAIELEKINKQIKNNQKGKYYWHSEEKNTAILKKPKKTSETK